MSHLPFTIAAYLLNAAAVTVDKFLLTKHIHNPLIYIFYISVFSMLALLLLPFTHFPNLQVLILASASTILWTSGAYFMYKALQIGQISRVIPVIGTLTPVILFMAALITGTINLNEIWAIIFLVSGLILLTLPDWKGNFKSQEAIYEIISSLLFAISYILLRQAYLQEDFLTVFVYSRPILLPVGLFILIVPKLRKMVLSSSGPNINFLSKAGLLFLAGQAAGGISELLLTFSISLANPALVNSLQGIQYGFLFILSIFLSKKFPKVYREKLVKASLISKIIGIILLGGGLYIMAFAHSVTKDPELGVTFSPKYAKELGLDPKKTYLEMLDELQVKIVRLPIYWDQVEKLPYQYDFSNEEFYVSEAEKRGVQIVLVVGYKQPRWPECFAPRWAKRLPPEERAGRILKLVEEEVVTFRRYSNIKTWQVENEPYLKFGECNVVADRAKLLPKEVQLVKSLDNRPVLITDSGELSTWRDAMKIGDIFGSTLYRTVWNPLFGSLDYPLPPFFYRIKAFIAQNITGTEGKPIIISELQAEPWAQAKMHIADIPIDEQTVLFPNEKIFKNVEYAKATNFSEVYLWGVEWWYFMKLKGHPEYVDTAKEAFSDN